MCKYCIMSILHEDPPTTPDLEFYYDVAKTNKTVTLSNASLTIATSINTIYLDKECKIPIGDYIFNNTVTYIGKHNSLSNSQFNISFGNYTDIIGGFNATNIGNPQNIPSIIDPNTTIVYNIYSGNGPFLGVSGYMPISADNSTIRHALVYFTKCNT